MGNQFNSLTLAGVSNTDAVPFAHSTMTASVISAVFQGDLIAQAVGAAVANQHAWAFRVVDIALPLPTRRPFVVEAGIAVQALNGHALARITVEGQTTSRQIRAATDPKAFNAQLRLPIRRRPQCPASSRRCRTASI